MFMALMILISKEKYKEKSWKQELETMGKTALRWIRLLLLHRIRGPIQFLG